MEVVTAVAITVDMEVVTEVAITVVMAVVITVAMEVVILNLTVLIIINLPEQKVGKIEVMEILLRILNMKSVGVGEKEVLQMRVK